MFDAQDVERSGFLIKKIKIKNKVKTPRQSGQSFLAQRHQEVALLWQTRPHWVFSTQSNKQR